jgi:hypothetical protein
MSFQPQTRKHLRARRFSQPIAFLFFICCHLFCPDALRAVAVPAHAQNFSWNERTQGIYPTCLARAQNGDIWAGGEDNGAWRYNASTHKWTQFTVNNGLGDNDIYALAVDKQNRVWVGHLNHGVSVWNGASWKNYDVASGPTGERIFDIAVNPKDGDVWIAHNFGLSRYSVSKDNWSNFSRASGLPSDQVNSLAFSADGDLYAGTLCDGIAIARTADGYKTWQNVRGSNELSSTDIGDGLPSSLINDVLVAGDGAIYVATTAGLAWSRDKGKSWRFSRGSDWLEKNKGRWKPAKVAPDAAQETLLLQDDVTCLAEDQRGFLWLGLRHQGYQVLTRGAGQIVYYSALEPGGANPMTTFPPSCHCPIPRRWLRVMAAKSVVFRFRRDLLKAKIRPKKKRPGRNPKRLWLPRPIRRTRNPALRFWRLCRVYSNASKRPIKP